jgi:transcriptional regulator with XRE-family HTH domain
MLSIKSPDDIIKELAKKLRQRRLYYTWSRDELARRAGITISSLKRFEITGEISLKRFLKLCFTLHALEGWDQILEPQKPQSIADIEKHFIIRKRGRRKPT